jgi:hypothetical protein
LAGEGVGSKTRNRGQPLSFPERIRFCPLVNSIKSPDGLAAQPGCLRSAIGSAVRMERICP